MKTVLALLLVAMMVMAVLAEFPGTEEGEDMEDGDEGYMMEDRDERYIMGAGGAVGGGVIAGGNNGLGRCQRRLERCGGMLNGRCCLGLVCRMKRCVRL